MPRTAAAVRLLAATAWGDRSESGSESAGFGIVGGNGGWGVGTSGKKLACGGRGRGGREPNVRAAQRGSRGRGGGAPPPPPLASPFSHGAGVYWGGWGGVLHRG